MKLSSAHKLDITNLTPSLGTWCRGSPTIGSAGGNQSLPHGRKKYSFDARDVNAGIRDDAYPFGRWLMVRGRCH